MPAMTSYTAVGPDGCLHGCGERLRSLCRVSVAFLVVFPLDVLYWRGTWDLWDHFSAVDCPPPHWSANGSPTADGPPVGAPENQRAACWEYTGSWISAAVGVSVCVVLNCASPLMASAGCRRCTRRAAGRLYSYAYSVAYLGQWRGTWNLIDAFCGSFLWRANLAGFLVCCTLNFAFRTHQNWTSSPWSVAVDTDEDAFISTPWLRSKPEDSMWQYCLDQLLSQVICVNLNISTWRYLWSVLEETVYPTDYDVSAALSLCSGSVILLLLILIHGPLAAYSSTLDDKPFQHSLFDGCCHLVVNVGVVCMWRGLWNLVSEHVIPDPLIGGFVCHSVGLIGLMALMSFRTAYDNSISRDGEAREGKGVVPQLTPVSGWTEISWRNKNTKGVNQNPTEDGDGKQAKMDESTAQALVLGNCDGECV